MNEEQAQPAPARSNRKWIALAIGGGCALVACLGLVVALAVTFLTPMIARTNQQVTVVSTEVVAPSPVTGGDTQVAGGLAQQPSNTMGNPYAPVTIVEYADFQCPFCVRYWQETERQIVLTYVKTGKVYYEYRSVGGFIGPESAAAAEAAYCAGDQGKFWEYHDTLFSKWTGENVGDFSADKLQQYAAEDGLDGDVFSNCLSSGKYADRLQQDVDSAKAAGVQATPSFLVNGKLIEGAQPFSVFQQAIEAALQGK